MSENNNNSDSGGCVVIILAALIYVGFYFIGKQLNDIQAQLNRIEAAHEKER